MFSSEILETAIGLTFIYLIASLAATSLREAIEGLFKTRSVQLERGIRQLLDDPSGTEVTKQLFDHPLLYSLFAGKYDPTQLKTFIFPQKRGAAKGDPPAKRMRFFSTLPAYVPSRNFALALMHLVSGTASNGGVLSIGSLQTNTAALPDGKLKQALQVALAESQGDLNRARASLEAWFDGTMDRVSGWYKRETQYILFAIGLVLAFSLNVDTIRIADTLLKDNTIRQRLVLDVEHAIPPPADDGKTAPPATMPDPAKLSDSVKDGLTGLIGFQTFTDAINKENASHYWADHVPFGMGAVLPPGLLIGLVSVPGWIMSALAISLGAPFWFDTLNKLMVIRSTVKPYEKSAPESSADRGENPPAAEALSPGPTASDGPADTPSAGAPGSGASGPIAPAIPVARLRLAFDGADPQTLSFARNGIPVLIPDDGHLELPLETGVDHRLVATGQQNGAPVRWEQIIRPTLDDEAEPITAMLA